MAPLPAKPLSLGWRRLIACIAILLFLGVYIVAVISIGAMLGDRGAWTMIFYAAAGLLWGVPVLPIISWSEAYKRKPGP
jgi:hypothetical protein